MKKKVCPRCGSRNVEWIIPQVWSRWVCYNCDYTGPIIEVDDEMENKIVKNWKENKEEILYKESLRKNKDNEEDENEELSDEEIDEKLKKLGI
ncbi:hypothetical protein [Methanobrevibacter sp. 87.7]|uniref:hypothetical protein n=1 Tax=Methanobrevibacter sp. 87.7 TaxID=387957 RepID=UPI000B511F03|nr:hypothetical protein [Methanobrevibacter sp. 87.7]